MKGSLKRTDSTLQFPLIPWSLQQPINSQTQYTSQAYHFTLPIGILSREARQLIISSIWLLISGIPHVLIHPLRDLPLRFLSNVRPPFLLLYLREFDPFDQETTADEAVRILGRNEKMQNRFLSSIEPFEGSFISIKSTARFRAVANYPARVDHPGAVIP